MAFQQIFQDKRAVVGIVAICGLVLAVVIWRSFGGNSNSGRIETQPYSDDDGVTYFSDAPNKMTPFDHNGKQAVMVTLVPGADGKMEVQYLARHTLFARQANEKAAAKNERPEMVSPYLEFKKARSAAAPWIPDNDPRSQAIRQPAGGDENGGKPAGG